MRIRARMSLSMDLMLGLHEEAESSLLGGMEGGGVGDVRWVY